MCKEGKYSHKSISLLIIWVCILLLTACEAGGEEHVAEPKGGVLTYAALNPVTAATQKTVEQFNDTHTDVQIEIRDYSDEGGLDRLRTELVLGQIPDIMEMHYLGKSPSRTGKNNEPEKGRGGNYTSWKTTGNSTLERPADEYWMPYRQMVQKGYLENLWPYIENDPELGREGVLRAPLEAAEVDSGLYLLFMDVRVITLMGPESVIGDRYGWTLKELLEVFADMREGSTILRYNAVKRDVFFDLLCFSLNKYVDIDTGTCSFNSREFRDLLAFLECFPNEADFGNPDQVAMEVMERVRTRRQMLEVTQIAWPEDLVCRDAFWGERTAFVGYPTEAGDSGSFFYPMGDVLAMSSTCQNKDAAWEYIRELIKPRRTNAVGEDAVVPFVSIPINRHDYDLFMYGQLVDRPKTFQYVSDQSRGQVDPVEYMSIFIKWKPFAYGPEIYPMALLTEEDGERFQALIDNTTQLYWPDDALSDIVWEALGPYFAGDKQLDDTLQLLDNRVSLYLNEQK